MEAKLLVVAGGPKDQVVQLPLPAVIGRSREADITIPHPLVSRRHCEIVLDEEGQLQVNDLGSLNGTFVGKNRVENSQLASGDLLTIGAVTFRAVYGPQNSESSEGEETLTPLEPIAELESDPDFVLTEDTMDASLDDVETDLLPIEDGSTAETEEDDKADFDLEWLNDEEN